MHKKNFLATQSVFLLILILSVKCIYAQSAFDCRQADPAAKYRDHPVDITRMKVELNFEPAIGKVKGKVTHYFTPIRKTVDTLFFDAPGITIQSCELNGKAVTFKTSETGVTVFFSPALHWEKDDSLAITYEVSPRHGIYFIGWNDPNNLSRKQIWTQGEGSDNRYWIPMFDAPNDKFITETVTTFDKDYNVLSNGTLLNGKKNTEVNQPELKPVVNKDGATRTWHYRMQHPMSGYLLMLAIDKYAVKTFYSKSGVRICNWYYPEWENRYEPTFRQTAQIMDFLEEETGVKFPWESYANVMVQDFMFGAMENTTATVFGDFYSSDARGYLDINYNGVNCHEMTHQWFGDLVTCEDWNDIWLHESFATFYPQLYTEKYYGEDAYEWGRRGGQNAATNASKNDRNPIRNSDAGSARIYNKGAGVLDMLRHYVGDEAFRKVIQYYTHEHGYKNVNTPQFEQAFKDVLGIDLKWFFDEWIYHGGEPAYTVTEQQATVDGHPALQINVQQTQKIDELTGLFKMPVVLEAYYTDGTKDSVTVWVQKASETFSIPLKAGKQFSFALFDPGTWVMKSITFKKSLDELKNQLAHAPLMIDKYDALVALRDTSFTIDNKREALIAAYRNNTYQAIRAEIVSQLAKDHDASSIQLLQDAFSDKDVTVRMAAVNNAGVTGNFTGYYEKALNDSSYNLSQAVLNKLVDANPAKAADYLNETSTVYGLENVYRINWLLLQAGRTKGSEQAPYINELLSFTSNSNGFRTRYNSANALKTLNYCDSTLVKNLFNGALSSNGRLSSPCLAVLDYFFAESQYKPMIRKQYAEGTWSKWQDAILSKYK